MTPTQKPDDTSEQHPAADTPRQQALRQNVAETAEEVEKDPEGTVGSGLNPP